MVNSEFVVAQRSAEHKATRLSYPDSPFTPRSGSDRERAITVNKLTNTQKARRRGIREEKEKEEPHEKEKEKERKSAHATVWEMRIAQN